MSIKTLIQWAHGTSNPAMGCNGCELFPTISQLIRVVHATLAAKNVAVTLMVTQAILKQFAGLTASDVYHSRQAIACAIMAATGAPGSRGARKKCAALVRAIADEFRCYAARLHLHRGEDANKPTKKVNKGYAPRFEQVTKFPGRMAEAANWKDLRGTTVESKPWLEGCPRMIFVSDMADLLSHQIDFEYILHEVIRNVASVAGSRHLWLWLTKRPHRMAEFSDWLESRAIQWPDNLVAMTSVTSQKTVGRVEQLKKVRSRHRGLSVEPLWDAVQLPLAGIDWVIVGGESGGGAKPFQLRWARDIQKQCKVSGSAFFLKQLGARPFDGEAALALKNRHGGDWSEWPADLRCREVPAGFKR